MNQTQLEVIVAIIKNGAPALANELVDALYALVNERNELKEFYDANQPENCEKQRGE